MRCQNIAHDLLFPPADEEERKNGIVLKGLERLGDRGLGWGDPRIPTTVGHALNFPVTKQGQLGHALPVLHELYLSLSILAIVAIRTRCCEKAAERTRVSFSFFPVNCTIAKATKSERERVLFTK